MSSEKGQFFIYNSSMSNIVYEFGPFTADPEVGVLIRSGKIVPLTPKAFEVLLALIRSGGTAVTRDHLLQAVWGDAFVEDANLTNAIWVLRKAFGENGDARYIETIPRRGYRFTAPVRERSPGVSREAEIKQTATRRGYHLVFGLGLASVLLLALAAFSVVRPHNSSQNLRYEQLTFFPDAVRSPALSPDGRMVAFLRCSGTGINCRGQLYLKVLPNGEPIALTRSPMVKAMPAFSPDGTRIAFTANGSTWTVPALGGEQREFLTNASGLTWTPGGQLLFSEVSPGERWRILTSMADGRDKRAIYTPAFPNGMAYASSLSPNGHWVLLAEMDLNGPLPCRVISTEGRGTGFIVGPPNSQCRSVQWSPDGHWMYFTAAVDGSFHIWRQRFPSGRPELLTTGPVEENGIAMAPDGHSLIAAAGTSQSAVWIRSAAGNRQISHEGYAFRPALSPDGDTVFYLIRRARSRAHWSGELWATSLTTGASERVVSDFLIQHFELSTDGSMMVFDSLEATGSRVWIGSTRRRSPPRPLSPSGETADQRPFIRNSGTVYFLHEERNGERFVYRMKLDGSDRRKAASQPVRFLVNVSPDEQWAIVWNRLPSRPEVTGMIALPLEGGAPIELCACGAGPKWRESPLASWTRDGKYILIGVPDRDPVTTIALPTNPGSMLPAIPQSQTLTASDLARIPGAIQINESSVAPGMNKDAFAFTRVSTHQNLFRIALPD